MSLRRGAFRQDYPVLDSSGFFSRDIYSFLTQEDYFEESGIAIVNGSITSMKHGLPVTPRVTSVDLVNVIAEFGYTAGMQVQVISFTDGITNHGASVVSGSANLQLIVGLDGIEALRMDAGNEGVYGAITNANWTMTVRAWA